jgi:hypothetical protein
MDPEDHGKRKMVEKDMPHGVCGRTAAARSSRDAPHGHGRREARDPYIEEEERLERLGHTTDAIPHTPLHLTKFDGIYIKDLEGEMLRRPPVDTHQHAITNYSKSWKLVEEARGINPYAVNKDVGIDYRFWNEFHSNFYATTILGARKSKIVKIQYVDWDELRDKEEAEFDKVIKICDRFQLSDIMGL